MGIDCKGARIYISLLLIPLVIQLEQFAARSSAFAALCFKLDLVSCTMITPWHCTCCLELSNLASGTCLGSPQLSATKRLQRPRCSLCEHFPRFRLANPNSIHPSPLAIAITSAALFHALCCLLRRLSLLRNLTPKTDNGVQRCKFINNLNQAHNR